MKAAAAVKTSVGEGGTVVIPARLRRLYGLEAGTDVVQEARPEGVLIRPAVKSRLRVYSDRDKAMFLLNNACSRNEYRAARQSVRALGLDPDKVKHHPFE